MAAMKGQVTRNKGITPVNAERYNKLLKLEELIRTNPIRSFPKRVEAYRYYGKVIDRSLSWVEKNVIDQAWREVPSRFNGEPE